MNTIINKDFDEFTIRMNDPEHREKMIAKKILLDLMRIFGVKKVKLIDITQNRIYAEYRVDSQYVYLLKFNRLDDNNIEFIMENKGRSISDLWNDRTFAGIHQRIIDNWDI